MADKDEHSELLKKLVEGRDGAFKKFPLLFTLLGAFGLSATFYGIQHILQDIPLLANNPIISLVAGLTILVFTGTLYKKLG